MNRSDFLRYFILVTIGSFWGEITRRLNIDFLAGIVLLLAYLLLYDKVGCQCKYVKHDPVDYIWSCKL